MSTEKNKPQGSEFDPLFAAAVGEANLREEADRQRWRYHFAGQALPFLQSKVAELDDLEEQAEELGCEPTGYALAAEGAVRQADALIERLER